MGLTVALQRYVYCGDAWNSCVRSRTERPIGSSHELTQDLSEHQAMQPSLCYALRHSVEYEFAIGYARHWHANLH